MANKLDLIQKPGTKSHIWNYFGVEKPNNGEPIMRDVAVCCTCYGKVAAKNGNTSNLLAHLRCSHERLYTEAKQIMSSKQPGSSSSYSSLSPLPGGSTLGQLTIQDAIVKTQKYKKKGKRWKELTDSVVYYIAKDCLPIYTVEKP